MVEYAVVPATKEHVLELAKFMSAEDVRECYALGFSPLGALRASMRVSRDTRTFLVDGRVASMFGVGYQETTLLGNKRPAMPWLLSTPLVREHAMHFLRGCKMHMDKLLVEHGHLLGHVDARHTVSIRWLKWLGFEVHEAKPYGLEGIDFHAFERVR